MQHVPLHCWPDLQRSSELLFAVFELGLAFCLILDATLQVGVLTRHILDDGRGFARSKVFKHGHEEATGRTSSIGQHNLCVSSLLQAPRNVCPCNAHVAVQCCLTAPLPFTALHIDSLHGVRGLCCSSRGTSTVPIKISAYQTRLFCAAGQQVQHPERSDVPQQLLR